MQSPLNITNYSTIASSYSLPSSTPIKNSEDTAEEFATILFSQMIQEMRSSGTDSDSEEGQGGLFSGDSNLFASFFDQSIGKTFAKAGGSGLVQALNHQLQPDQESRRDR
jgi:Rod binding domain-containing protein